jgi:hypothetical protein
MVVSGSRLLCDSLVRIAYLPGNQRRQRQEKADGSGQRDVQLHAGGLVSPTQSQIGLESIRNASYPRLQRRRVHLSVSAPATLAGSARAARHSIRLPTLRGRSLQMTRALRTARALSLPPRRTPLGAAAMVPHEQRAGEGLSVLASRVRHWKRHPSLESEIRPDWVAP